ncbi:hypothetical protein [Rhizobium sp. L245/93]|uniref:hypothetical protein n=1 Tax=Rhizobium sp. L245/93 TaxID=2819998 RepID=UPI001ADACE95|nr:hypothetical protein [Rhizobium sp. L245/93]MBO9170915.1 hypothetical protein [Rhizobium sp. L245/93]
MTGSPRRPGPCKFYQDLGQTLSEAVAIVARYDCVKDANGKTRRVRNKRSETESPDPEIPEAGFLPWDYYWELRLSEASVWFWRASISNPELVNWLQVTGVGLMLEAKKNPRR